VRIEDRNIQQGVKYNFMKYTNEQVKSYGVAYDYLSVMHYGQRVWLTISSLTIYLFD